MLVSANFDASDSFAFRPFSRLVGRAHRTPCTRFRFFCECRCILLRGRWIGISTQEDVLKGGSCLQRLARRFALVPRYPLQESWIPRLRRYLDFSIFRPAMVFRTSLATSAVLFPGAAVVPSVHFVDMLVHDFDVLKASLRFT